MTSKLQVILDQAAQAKNAEQEKAKELRLELKAKAFDALWAWMGPDVSEVLRPQIIADPKVDFFNNNAMVEITCTMEGAPLELCDMEIHWCPNYRGGNYVKLKNEATYHPSMPAEWVHVVAAARRAFVRMAKEAEQKEQKKFLEAMEYEHWWGKDETGAKQALTSLIGRWPEKEEEWLAAYATWEAAYQADMEAQARKRAEIDAYQAREKAQVDVIQAFVERWLSVLRRNRERLAAIQKQVSAPFQVFELTYAVVAEEDGEKIIEQHTKLVELLDGNEPGKEFISIPSRKRIHMFYPVSLMPVTIVPEGEAGPAVKKLYVPEAQGYLFYAYYTDEEEMKRLVASVAWEPFPQDVPAGEGIHRNEAVVHKALEGMDTEGCFRILISLIMNAQVY